MSTFDFYGTYVYLSLDKISLRYKIIIENDFHYQNKKWSGHFSGQTGFVACNYDLEVRLCHGEIEQDHWVSGREPVVDLAIAPAMLILAI
jgi:hypothetical protein